MKFTTRFFILLVKMMLCSKLHCQKGFNLNPFSYKILPAAWHSPPCPRGLPSGVGGSGKHQWWLRKTPLGVFLSHQRQIKGPNHNSVRTASPFSTTNVFLTGSHQPPNPEPPLQVSCLFATRQGFVQDVREPNPTREGRMYEGYTNEQEREECLRERSMSGRSKNV